VVPASVTRYSNALLALLLRCRRSEVYGNWAAVKTPSTPKAPPIDPGTSTDAVLLERIRAVKQYGQAEWVRRETTG
jgi:hypothetical protein